MRWFISDQGYFTGTGFEHEGKKDLSSHSFSTFTGHAVEWFSEIDPVQAAGADWLPPCCQFPHVRPMVLGLPTLHRRNWVWKIFQTRNSLSCFLLDVRAMSPLIYTHRMWSWGAMSPWMVLNGVFFFVFLQHDLENVTSCTTRAEHMYLHRKFN